MSFLNRTGAEIGYYFDEKCNKIIFSIEKIKKYRKWPALFFLNSEVGWALVDVEQQVYVEWHMGKDVDGVSTTVEFIVCHTLPDQIILTFFKQKHSVLA